MWLIWRFFKKLIALVFVVSTIVAIHNTFKSLPAGTNLFGGVRAVPAESVSFLADTTYLDAAGKRHSDQRIFDEVSDMVRGAKHFILLDMFLYNAYQGSSPETTLALSSELTDLLVAKKQEIPDISITVITDPINETYGGDTSPQFEKLRQAGVAVITTNLSRLRDSNPLYSGFWRTLFRGLGNSSSGGIMPHPFQSGGRKVGIRSWLALFNFKANHRKLIVADEETPKGTKISTLVTSANPHDGSGAHGNIAIKVSDSLYQDAILSEQAVAEFSFSALPKLSIESFTPADDSGPVEVRLLTEGAIRDAFLGQVRSLTEGDTLDMTMFYLSERTVVKELIRAAKRGVSIRLILDPNRDAFGHKKNGVPNRSVAAEMVSATRKAKSPIMIRWCDTHGEQCHAKLTLIHAVNVYDMIGGSANLTRRNINNYNLETNVEVRSTEKIPAIADAYDYFEKIWTNRNGLTYTVDYAAYKDTALYKRVLYRIMEYTGMSSF